MATLQRRRRTDSKTHTKPTHTIREQLPRRFRKEDSIIMHILVTGTSIHCCNGTARKKLNFLSKNFLAGCRASSSPETQFLGV